MYKFEKEGGARLRELQSIQSANNFSGWNVLGKPQLEIIDRYCRKGWCHGRSSYDEVWVCYIAFVGIACG